MYLQLSSGVALAARAAWSESEPGGARDCCAVSHEKGLTPRVIPLEEVFAPSTMDV